MAIQVQSFQFNPFQENTFLVYDQDKNCVIIDPGCYEVQEENELFGFIETHQLKPIALLNTHAHIDHILGNASVKTPKTVQATTIRQGEVPAGSCRTV